jgi:anti-anti-sigma factor
LRGSMVNGKTTTTGITVDRNVGGGASMVYVTGRIGIEEANELQRRFDEFFKAGRPWVIMSLTDVDFICSAGMGTLLSAVGEARKGGGELIFTYVSVKVRTIFEFLDIWDYITTAPDKEAALEMVAAGRRMQERRAAPVMTPSFVADDLKAKLERGISTSKAGKLKDALSYFNAVIKADKNNVTALTWKSNVLERLGQFNDARRLYKRVCEIARGDPRLLSYARGRVEKLNQKLRLATGRDRALEQLKATARDLAQAPRGLPNLFAPERTVDESEAPFLLCCRTWDGGASFGDEQSGLALARGGGYFLWVGGRGVVLNPGKNFTARFAQAGRRLADVDALMVTNVAWDLNADLEPLLEAVRRYNKAGVGSVKKVDVYVNAGVYKKNYSWLSAAKDVVSKLTVLYPGHGYRVGDAALDVKAADVPESRADEALGLVFTAGTASFAYVADAACADVDVLAAQYAAAKNHVLLTHVGPVYSEGDPAAGWPADYLGVEALGKLLLEVKPSVALLTEMSNVADPVALSAAITKATDVRCFPLDVGLAVNLGTMEIIAGDAAIPIEKVNVHLGADGRLRYRAAG